MPSRARAPGLVRNLERRGDAPALVWQNGAVTSYRALGAEAAAFAGRLPAEKALVALEAAPCLPFVAAYIGALQAGHAVALLPPQDAALRAFFLERFRPDVVYSAIESHWTLEIPAGRAPDPAHHPDLALVLLTSGSTGEAKAVRLSATALEANAEAIAQYLGLGPRDCAALVLPLHYCYGLSVLHSHLFTGASVFFPGCSVLDSGFAGKLREHCCTNLAGVPYSFDLLERSGFDPDALPDLRFMTVAGGRLAPERVRAWHDRLFASNKRLFVMYGQTEATARIAYLPPEQAARRPDSIGIPIPGGALSILGEDGEEITEPEAPGELVYRGPNVMMGYAADRADLARDAEIDRLHTRRPCGA